MTKIILIYLSLIHLISCKNEAIGYIRSETHNLETGSSYFYQLSNINEGDKVLVLCSLREEKINESQAVEEKGFKEIVNVKNNQDIQRMKLSFHSKLQKNNAKDGVVVIDRKIEFFEKIWNYNCYSFIESVGGSVELTDKDENLLRLLMNSNGSDTKIKDIDSTAMNQFLNKTEIITEDGKSITLIICITKLRGGAEGAGHIED